MNRREARFEKKLQKYKGKKRLQIKRKLRLTMFTRKVNSYSPEFYEVRK